MKDGHGINWLRVPLELGPAATEFGALGYELPFTMWPALSANDQSLFQGHRAALEVRDYPTERVKVFPL